MLKLQKIQITCENSKNPQKQNRGAQVKDLLGDHPSLAHTCPSTKVPKEIHHKSQPNWQTKIPKNSSENHRKRKKTSDFGRRLRGTRNCSLCYFMRSSYKPLLSKSKLRMVKSSIKEPLLSPSLPSPNQKLSTTNESVIQRHGLHSPPPAISIF